MTEGIQQKSIGSFVAEKIVDLAKSSKKEYILDELSIYGLSDKDGSATLTLEWHGASDGDQLFSKDIFTFLNEIRSLIISQKKETREQLEPSITPLDGFIRVIYRFRIWDIDGQYEFHNKTLVKM